MQLSKIEQNIKDTQKEIDKLEAEKKSREGQISAATKTADSQDNYVRTLHCSGTKKKKDACNQRKREINIDTKTIRTNVSNYKKRVNEITKNILPKLRADLAEYNDSLVKYHETQRQVDKDLADQGKTRDSVIEEVKTQSEIDKMAAAAGLKTKKTQKYVILGLATVAVLVVGYIGVKRFSK